MIHNSKLGKYFLIALMFFIANGVFGQDKKLNIEGQLALEVGSPGGAKVTVEKSGRSAGSATVASNGQFELALDFDSDYTITISQTGFVPVKYRVVTNASSDAKRDGLMPFSMPVFLVQTYTGAPDGSKIMATAKFDEVLYDFDFDKADYKSITSQKKVLLAQKSAAVAANGANAEAELKAKQEAIAKRYAEEEAARKKAEAEEERLRKEKEIQDKYDAAIAKADKAFTQSEWEYAKQFYQEASTTKPAEAYPKTKLTELENRIANEKKYTAAMEKGAAAMTAKDYTLAKTAFNEALAAKPNDAPAKGKIAEADAALAELNKQKELDSKYTALIAAADKLFVAKKWAEAKASYTEALKLKPTEEHPKTRIAESDKMIAEEEAQKANEKQLNDSYNAAITKADKLFTEKKWADAKSAYGEALALKPAEVAPKNKIKEIEALEKAEADKAAKEKELDEKFTAAISKGDAAFGSQKLAEAKAAFSEALALKPAEAYPKTKITEIDKLIAADAQKAAEEKALNDKYNAALTKGSAAFTAKKYSEAKTAYSEAASLKPSEELPKTQLAKIEELIAKDEADKAAEKQLTDQYNAAMKKGDTEFAAKNFAGARTAFNEAAGLKPAEALPKTKIKEVETADAVAVAVKDAGFDVLQTSNNHTCDKGGKGVKRTLNVLDSLGIEHFGSYRSTEEAEISHPFMKDVHGIKIAMLNYTYGTNGMPVPIGTVVNLIDTLVIQKDLAKAKTSGADFIIATYHWGIEYQRNEAADQRKIAEFTAKHGADLIIGGHPHVVQPIKKINGEKDSIYVVYSLGNYISNQRDRYKNGGIMTEITLVKTVNKTYLKNIAYVPVWVYKKSTPKVSYTLVPGFMDSTIVKDTLINMSSADKILMNQFFDDTRKHLKEIGERK
jgi:poly-gamma-glutamate capsule biosynthesis protein CapA/YwtB (metallophosphatase superfamily)